MLQRVASAAARSSRPVSRGALRCYAGLDPKAERALLGEVNDIWINALINLIKLAIVKSLETFLPSSYYYHPLFYYLIYRISVPVIPLLVNLPAISVKTFSETTTRSTLSNLLRLSATLPASKIRNVSPVKAGIFPSSESLKLTAWGCNALGGKSQRPQKALTAFLMNGKLVTLSLLWIFWSVLVTLLKRKDTILICISLGSTTWKLSCQHMQ